MPESAQNFGWMLLFVLAYELFDTAHITLCLKGLSESYYLSRDVHIALCFVYLLLP